MIGYAMRYAERIMERRKGRLTECQKENLKFHIYARIESSW